MWTIEPEILEGGDSGLRETETAAWGRKARRFMLRVDYVVIVEGRRVLSERRRRYIDNKRKAQDDTGCDQALRVTSGSGIHFLTATVE